MMSKLVEQELKKYKSLKRSHWSALFSNPPPEDVEGLGHKQVAPCPGPTLNNQGDAV